MVDKPKKFKAMARFRNRLVHTYWQVDDRSRTNYFHNRLGNFRAVSAAIDAAAA